MATNVSVSAIWLCAQTDATLIGEHDTNDDQDGGCVSPRPNQFGAFAAVQRLGRDGRSPVLSRY